MHGINDTGPAACESCGGAMRKTISPPAIHFKGSGWAKKDAASKARSSTKKEADAKTTGESKEAASDSAGGETGGQSEKKASSADKGKTAASAGSASD